MTHTTSPKISVTDEEALALHAQGRPGKIEIIPTKPLVTQRDLALAYSPGVAAPCLKIEQNPELAYDYTSKGNLVAVISNGTAVLGLGNIGALASKPVMEGKAVLFKRFSDIDSIDIEVNTQDVDTFVNSVEAIADSFGGINLEDIKAPECFLIEQKLKERLSIPVFHDDQHGTAITTLAALINALYLTHREIEKTKLVVSGAGAAAIACVELLEAYGLDPKNVTLCDREGVIYKGRPEMDNVWKEKHAVETNARTLEEALVGADVFLGLSGKGALKKEMIKAMAPDPIIFAMANPDPEIAPEDVHETRPDAIMATGRSDYPNQVNNILGFPYIFRGALDVRATIINEEMKIAAAEALAALARQPVPEEVHMAYAGRKLVFGRSYILPVPFDPRLIETISVAVAEAAIRTKVALKPYQSKDSYRLHLRKRLSPTSAHIQLVFESVRAHPQKMVFSEGEEEKFIRAAFAYASSGYGEAILIGNESHIKDKMAQMHMPHDVVSIINPVTFSQLDVYIDHVYERVQRKGIDRSQVEALFQNEKHVLGACLVAFGKADGLLAGTLSTHHPKVLTELMQVVDLAPHQEIFGLSLFLSARETIFVADTAVHVTPTPEQLVTIAKASALKVRNIGFTPRVAFIDNSCFGSAMCYELKEQGSSMRQAITLLDKMDVDFEYEGEMTAAMALDPNLKTLYPFSRLSEPANILIMPSLQASGIGLDLAMRMSPGNIIGPLFVGFSKAIQTAEVDSPVSELANLAVFAAHDAYLRKMGRG